MLGSQFRITASAFVLSFGLVACGGAQKTAETAPGAPAAAAPEPAPASAARVEVRDDKIVIAEKVQFDAARATIRPESFGLLDEVVATIKKNPQIKRLAVEGHASAEGSESFNFKLSDDRAKSVVAYLVSKGIPKEMLTAQGYGVSRPLSDNETPVGREKNRRVEFTIVEQELTQRKVAVDATGKETVLVETKSVVTRPATESAAGAKVPSQPR